MIIGSAKGGVTLPNKNNLSVAIGGGGGGTPAWFEDDYSDASLWTQDGSEINVNSDYADHVGGTNVTQTATNQRVYRSLPADLNDALWYMDITMTTISMNNHAQLLSPVISHNNVYAYGAVDLLGIDTIWDGCSAGYDQLRGWCRYFDSGSGQIYATGVCLPIGTTFYARLQRDSATQATITMYDDADRTEVTSGFPQVWTIPSTFGSSSSGTSLNTIQHSNFASGDVRAQAFKQTDVKIYDDVAP